jgi:2-C-methyl-D-erythritol 4-phosphate cytidylyltransferase
MKKYAVIVAGGAGVRMENPTPKQFLPLRGKTMLWYTVRAFFRAYPDIYLIVVLPVEYLAEGKKILAEFDYPGSIHIVAGGSTRFQSVKNGLKPVPDDALVLVHDAVRCLVQPEKIRQWVDAALKNGNAIPAVTATDTIRITTNGKPVQVNRNQVYAMQTPQIFFASSLQKAFAQDEDETITDEAGAVEKCGEDIHLVPGDPENIKITRPIDLFIAEKILEARGE